MVTPNIDRRRGAAGSPGIRLSPAQLKSRRSRNVAIGLLIGGLVLLIYVLTIAKLGPGVLDRPI